MERGLSYDQTWEYLWMKKSTVRYYSKLPQKYIDRVYDMGSNKSTKEIHGGLIAIKVNNKLKR